MKYNSLRIHLPDPPVGTSQGHRVNPDRAFDEWSGMGIPTNGRKLFVLDTNVLLYDHNCIDNFQEHDVVLPITVLEELDEFKKGSDLINFQASEFIR